MVKKDFPQIHFYDQDFVDIYDQTWAWLQDYWMKGGSKNGMPSRFFLYPESETVNQTEACYASFFLVYSNRSQSIAPLLDIFYTRQEEDGAIRSDYRIEDGKPHLTPENPEGVAPPLFAWAEFNLYHKGGQKKRIKEIVPVLEKHYLWLEENFKDENGLYAVPRVTTQFPNSPLENSYYLVDFNTQQAMNALYISALGDVLNDKEISFRFKKRYFSLKTRISSMMWNQEKSFYFDLDKNEEQITRKTIGGFWPLLAEIPNEDRAERLIQHLREPESFGVENPFPVLAADDPDFDENGAAGRGAVYPHLTFMVIKGLEKHAKYEFARECAIRHLYNMLDTLHPEGGGKGNLWEAYAPRREGPARWEGHEEFPRPRFLTYTALATITLMIENVVGLYISLPRKTVDWIIPTLEAMGVENLSLKRNMITILSSKSGRGWEIRLESEKLYYFTINILGKKKKTLPIPSGKCSMLIDKL